MRTNICFIILLSLPFLLASQSPPNLTSIRTGEDAFVFFEAPFGTSPELRDLGRYSGTWREVADSKRGWQIVPEVGSSEELFEPRPDEFIYLSRITKTGKLTEIALGVVEWDTLNDRYKIETYRVVVRLFKKNVVFFFAVPDKENRYLLARGDFDAQLNSLKIYLPNWKAVAQLTKAKLNPEKTILLRSADLRALLEMNSDEFQDLFDRHPKYTLNLQSNPKDEQAGAEKE